MTKNYDPQYNTQPSFNAPVVQNIVRMKDLNKINHWIANGEPHKRLAEVAFISSLESDWMEGIEAIWNSGWCSNKGLVSKAWNHIIASRYTQDKFNNSVVCQWLYNKTFNEKFLTKSELNNLGVSLLEIANYHNTSFVWDIFFSIGLTLKGKKSEELFRSLTYFRYYNEANKNHKNQSMYSQEKIDTYQKRIDQVLQNGIQISYLEIISVLFKGYDELFWQIIDSKVIINEKDLTVLLIFITLYFKQFVRYAKKEPVNSVEATLERILKSFIKWGLPEKVVLKAKDIEDNYANILNNGQGHFSLKALPCFGGYLGNYRAYHIDYIEYSNYSYSTDRTKIIDAEIYTGDVFFAEPVDKRGNGFYDDISYVPLTDEQKAEYRQKMKDKIQEYK